jgi:hypothetical protein
MLLLILFLGQALQSNPKLLDITLQKDLTFLNLKLYFILFIYKKINPWHHGGDETN